MNNREFLIDQLSEAKEIFDRALLKARMDVQAALDELKKPLEIEENMGDARTDK